ncbi:M24 family metallopeptidase [Lactococcus termiticola]|uniref:Xaa-Pro aminopeptidase n=1 Tax=Lactococcus termiticola TaxID=2169526 RepID=A0A2R5HE20_9LACT|nr:Xaa-Pro peptidase family protein [Lactococcus termiticola]GBG96327.1 Xaa-Pro aminopeptidase [Lactococcus termiticola]
MRLQAIRERLEQEGLDAIIITDMKNIFYLTGFSGTAGTVFITDKEQFLITDDRYFEMAKSLVVGVDVINSRNAIGYISEHLALGLERIAFEDTVDYAFYKSLSQAFEAELLARTDFLMELRQIKSEDEIRKMRKAADIADRAFTDVLNFIKAGKTEIEVANFLDFKMREYGASGLSFDTIVASGKRSSLPHGLATDKIIQVGDPITIDFGCYYEHYASDMTRTVFLGQAEPKMAEIYHLVKAANEALIAKARAGMKLSDYDAIPRQVIDQGGYANYFTHGIGHGLGLDVHEIPYFSKTAKGEIKAGMVLTDEPGIYIPDFGGVRIEDDLLITENGCEVLTSSSKALTII